MSPSKSSKLSQMLGVASVSSVGDLSPYWSERCQELQSILWSPDGLLDVEADRSQHLIARLPNTTNFPQMCSSDLLPRFIMPTTDGNRPAIKQVVRKIRIYPTNKLAWERCLHAARRAYNLCIAELRGYDEAEDKEVWKKSTPSMNQTAFRRTIRERVSLEFPDVPRTIIDEAVNAAYTSRQNVIRLRIAIKNGAGPGDMKTCELNFRRRHDQKQSFIVHRLRMSGPFPMSLQCHITEAIPKEAIRKMASVVCERGRWFICVQINVTIAQAENQSGAIVACDPGVRTFMTTFAFDGCAKIGDRFAAKIRPMLLRLDKLLSERSKHNNAVDFSRQVHKDRRRYFEKRIWSIKNKISDLISDLHKRAADWLTSNYDVILLPSFQVSEIISKKFRKISKKVVRAMLGLAHFKFKTYLHWIAFKRGKLVVECSEAYTSRTDSRTGEVVDVGSSLTINGLDRDINGARGILLRALAT